MQRSSKKILAICIQQYNKKSYRKGEISYDIPYILNLKRNDTDELIYETQTQSMNLRLLVGEDWGEEIVRDFGVDTLLYLKWMTNKDLL